MAVPTARRSAGRNLGISRKDLKVLPAFGSTALLACILAWIAASPNGATPPRAPTPASASASANSAPGPRPRGPRPNGNEKPSTGAQRLEYRHARLADELARAEYKGPDPMQAYRRLGRHWRKMLDPYGSLPPDKAYLRLKVGFLTPDVKNYLKPGASRRHRYLGRGDRKWTYTKGVYESKLCLMAPFRPVPREGPNLPEGASYAFELDLPAGAVLEFAVGVIPESSGVQSAARFAVDVEVDGRLQRVWKRTIPRDQFLMWHDDRVELTRFGGRKIRLHLKTRGVNGAGLWADPAVFGSPGPSGPNVLFIVVDTLRPDGVGALTGRHARTPHMDSLVRSGTRMTRFYSNGSWTRASMVAFFSASYANSVGLSSDTFSFPRGTRRKFYARRPPQLPHHIDRHGYVTAGVVNNFFALPFASIGVDHGFPSLTDVRHRVWDNDAINRGAIKFLQKHRRRRFFLYVHYETAHDYDKNPGPLASQFPLPPGSQMNLYFRAYLTLTQRIDRYVGELIQVLRRLGLDKRTLIILTSDHGETFDARHDHFVPHYGMRMRYQHARSTWDEVLHIPMVWVLPGRVPQNKEVAVQLQAIDLAPAILDFLGLPPMKPVKGRTFWPLVRDAGNPPKAGDKAYEDRPVFAEGFHIRGLRAHGHKYIFRDRYTRTYRYRGRVLHRPEELFDLKTDPAETRNLSLVKPEFTAEMRALMNRLLKTSAAATSAGGKKDTDPVFHLRLCGEGRPNRLTGRVEVLGRKRKLVLTGASGRLSLKPVDAAMTALDLDMRAAKGCSGFDWSAPPDSRMALRLKLNGKPLTARSIRAGPYGLSLLKRSVLGPTTSSLLMARRPPVLWPITRAGVFLWQDTTRSSAALLDGQVHARDKASQDMVRKSLIRGGYIKKGQSTK